MSLFRVIGDPFSMPQPWQVGSPYRVILFYRYVSIDDVPLLEVFLRQRCEDLGLLGRVLIAKEGINGTLAGSFPCIDAFIEWMAEDIRFRLIDWKSSIEIDQVASLPFLNLSIRQVSELVSCGGKVRPYLASQSSFEPSTYGGLSNTGTHLSPAEFHHAIENLTTDGLLLDIRNQFEYDIGHFNNAKPLNCVTYSESWATIDGMLQDKDPVNTPVYMYCTGGIRCEKASVYIRTKGFQDVYLLRGGIHKYLECYPNGSLFQGKNFVFDGRVSMHGEENSSLVGRCVECESPFDTFSGKVVCTVCRQPVLVCESCRSSRCYPGEYHCWRHQSLKQVYFTVLERFAVVELDQQRDALKAMEEGMMDRSTPTTSSKKYKNKRATLRKQQLKITARIQYLLGATSVIKDNVGVATVIDSNIEIAPIMETSTHIPTLIDSDDPLSNPKTRLGWGFWKS